MHTHTITQSQTHKLTNSQTHKLSCICAHSHTHTLTHSHIHIYTYTRLSPEFYDNIIRLPIPISSGVLMMIGVLPMHPSPHVSFVLCWLVDGIRGLGRVACMCLDEVRRIRFKNVNTKLELLHLHHRFINQYYRK